MAFNSKEYEWADLTLLLDSNDQVGIRAIKYTTKVEKEAIYGKGRHPHSIQVGNKSYEGEIEVLQSDYEAMVAASSTKSVLDQSYTGIVAYGNAPNPIITDEIIGISFTEEGKDVKQGDKMILIKLPFIALRVENQS